MKLSFKRVIRNKQLRGDMTYWKGQGGVAGGGGGIEIVLLLNPRTTGSVSAQLSLSPSLKWKAANAVFCLPYTFIRAACCLQYGFAWWPDN